MASWYDIVLKMACYFSAYKFRTATDLCRIVLKQGLDILLRMAADESCAFQYFLHHWRLIAPPLSRLFKTSYDFAGRGAIFLFAYLPSMYPQVP